MLPPVNKIDSYRTAYVNKFHIVNLKIGITSLKTGTKVLFLYDISICMPYGAPICLLTHMVVVAYSL